MVIIDPIQEYLEYDVYQDLTVLVYPVLVKLEKLAKKSGCAVVLLAESDGAGSGHGDVWKYEFAGTISSVLCMERLKPEGKEITLLHKRCILAPAHSLNWKRMKTNIVYESVFWRKEFLHQIFLGEEYSVSGLKQHGI